jgi:hypothetical protein
LLDKNTYTTIFHKFVTEKGTQTMGLLINNKQKYKCRVLTEETLDETGARLEHTPKKSLKRLAQETGVPKSSAGIVTQLLKPSNESWCLVCCKGKKDCCISVFNETINCEKYLHIERTAFSTPPVICELQLLHSEHYQP